MAEEIRARLGATRGRTRITSIPGTRVFYKPSLGKVVFRPINVIRSSEHVVKINMQLEALRGRDEHPAKKCKGKPWREFISCLKDEMKRAIKKVK